MRSKSAVSSRRTARRLASGLSPILALSLFLGLGSGSSVRSETLPDPAEQARAAALQLVAAVEGLSQAESAPDQIAALTELVQAHEAALAGLRAGLAGLDRQEAALAGDLALRSEEVAGLVGALLAVRRVEGPALLTHPAGPLGTARAWMLMAEAMPALQADADALAAELAALRDIRQARDTADRTLAEGLTSLRRAHDALAGAIATEQPAPPVVGQDEAMLLALLESAQTLEVLSAGLGGLLTGSEAPAPGLAEARGTLPLPVRGRLIGREMQGAEGQTRPALLIETAPGALVTNPWPALLRYSGRLEDYGNVILLEPGEGYLLLIAGLDQVYAATGQEVPAGAPLGLMQSDTGDEGTITGLPGVSAPRLFMELRHEGRPIDPGSWFDLTDTGP